MRIRDLIECNNERDLKQTLSDFNADRIGALTLRITEVPEMEYFVECYGLAFPSNAYCQTMNEANEVLRKESKLVSMFVF